MANPIKYPSLPIMHPNLNTIDLYDFTSYVIPHYSFTFLGFIVDKYRSVGTHMEAAPQI